VKKISKYCAWHIIGTHFIFVELMNILPCSLISASIVIQQKVVWQGEECQDWWFDGLTVRMPQLYQIPFAEGSCHHKASNMCHQRRCASFSYLYFITHTHIFPSKSYPHIFRVLLKLYLLHLIAISPGTWHSSTYCQWPAPYKILAKHARSPLHYWESPCSHSPSWFVGTASYLACIA